MSVKIHYADTPRPMIEIEPKLEFREDHYVYDFDRVLSVSAQQGGIVFHLPHSLAVQLKDALVNVYGMGGRAIHGPLE
jgi:hypothetical protein